MKCCIRDGVEDLLTTAADGLRLESEDRAAAVVPTFNEAENIAPFLRSVYGDSFEVIVVDDDSPDSTWRLASDLCAALPHLRVLRRREERGLASAVIRGWQAASGEILATIDADFQHQPEMLARMRCRGLADIPAARFAWRTPARTGSRSRSVPADLGPAQRVLRRAPARDRGVGVPPRGYKGLIEILARGRVTTIGECAYQMCKRKSGRSNAAIREYWRYLRHLLRLRRTFREAAPCR